MEAKELRRTAHSSQDELAARSSQQQPGPNTPPAVRHQRLKACKSESKRQRGERMGKPGKVPEDFSGRASAWSAACFPNLCQVARERCDDHQEIATSQWSLERRTSRKLEAMKCSQGKQLGRAAKNGQEQLEAASVSGSDERQQ
ncbi:hypothetical protein HaLaN_32626 [Haematococcus lacustris]|uniref:Uncharacterized protein n=1 Tax=Haematococcus lacustris TaxID=44745 RepID=A0A6A0AK07_HAELA|nr:hypothetical protein HaLaN_32626 [Haematococcus lacustris]